MYLYFSNSGSYGRQIILNYFQPKGTFREGNGVITKKKTAWNPFSNPKLVILGDFLANFFVANLEIEKLSAKGQGGIPQRKD